MQPYVLLNWYQSDQEYLMAKNIYQYLGFHVANSIYSMLKNSPGVFNPLEVTNLSVPTFEKNDIRASIKEQYLNSPGSRAWQCSSAPCVMILTTGASTTSS